MRYLILLICVVTLWGKNSELNYILKTDQAKVSSGMEELIRSAGEEIISQNDYQITPKSHNSLTVILKRHSGKELMMKGILNINGVKKYKTYLFSNQENSSQKILTTTKRFLGELFNPRVKRVIKVSSDAEFNLSATWNHNEIKGLADTILKKMIASKPVKKYLKKGEGVVCVSRIHNQSYEKLPLESLTQLIQKGIVDYPNVTLLGKCSDKNLTLQGRVTLLKGKKNNMITKSYMISVSLIKPDQSVIWMHVENLKKIILLDRKQ